MKRIVLFWALASILFSVTSLYAQVHEQSKKPGDVLKFDVSFAGQDADKVQSVTFSFGFKGGGDPKQSGFNGGFDGNGKKLSPHTFNVEATIPHDIASGDYALNQVNASADAGQVLYRSPKDFPPITFHIENSQTFIPPTITITPQP
jgi:hypothetical protein